MDPKDFNLTKAGYSINETNAIVPLGRSRIQQDINNGKLEAVRSGKRIIITAPALVRYLTSLPPRKPKTS